uniref:Uncharacterized protein n=1 Tax=Setaria italica TaxID=4555 RepID=K3XTI2_SETIT
MLDSIPSDGCCDIILNCTMFLGPLWIVCKDEIEQPLKLFSCIRSMLGDGYP